MVVHPSESQSVVGGEIQTILTCIHMAMPYTVMVEFSEINISHRTGMTNLSPERRLVDHVTPNRTLSCHSQNYNGSCVGCRA